MAKACVGSTNLGIVGSRSVYMAEAGAMFSRLSGLKAAWNEGMGAASKMMGTCPSDAANIPGRTSNEGCTAVYHPAVLGALSVRVACTPACTVAEVESTYAPSSEELLLDEELLLLLEDLDEELLLLEELDDELWLLDELDEELLLLDELDDELLEELEEGWILGSRCHSTSLISVHSL